MRISQADNLALVSSRPSEDLRWSKAHRVNPMTAEERICQSDQLLYYRWAEQRKSYRLPLVEFKSVSASTANRERPGASAQRPARMP
jgi:hypothetical protein